MIGFENDWFLATGRRFRRANPHHRGGGGFGPLLINNHERLVDDLIDVEVFAAIHP